MDLAILNFAHICETAFLSQQGKLNIIGMFEQINAVQFPVKQAKMTLVMNLNLKEGKYPFKIRMIHEEKNTEVAKIEGELNCKKEGKTGLINEFLDVGFTESGQYAIEIWVNNEPTGKVPFAVHQVSQK